MLDPSGWGGFILSGQGWGAILSGVRVIALDDTEQADVVAVDYLL